MSPQCGILAAMTVARWGVGQDRIS